MTEAEIENIKAIAVLQAELTQTKKDVAEINAKLDDLLELKAKGAGAFWIASSLIGVVFYLLFDWIKGSIY